jgi:DNA-binding FadR family transcriptional regulator
MPATHNPVITLIVEGLSSVLYQVLQQRRQLVRAIPGAAERTNATHILILQAICDRDPERAVRAMENHFAVWNEESTRERVNRL